MEANRFPNESFYFFLRVADDAETGEIRAIGSPAVALVLDYHQVRAHLLGLRSPACRRPFAAVTIIFEQPDELAKLHRRRSCPRARSAATSPATLGSYLP